MDESQSGTNVKEERKSGPNDSSSDEDESFKTCNNTTVENSTTNAPPELSDDSDLSNSDNSSDIYLSENNDDGGVEDTDISDPGQEQGDADDDRNMETSFQRELLDYLGSLFNVSSRIRLRDNRQPVTVTDDQLKEYKDLLEKVESEMKILGVASMMDATSSDQSIARNLYHLLAARERGDWTGCRRYMRVVPMWTFETKEMGEEDNEKEKEEENDDEKDEKKDEKKEIIMEVAENDVMDDDERAINEAINVNSELEIGAQLWANDCDDEEDGSSFVKVKVKEKEEKGNEDTTMKVVNIPMVDRNGKENIESVTFKRSFHDVSMNEKDCLKKRDLGRRRRVFFNKSKKCRLDQAYDEDSVTQASPVIIQVARLGQRDLRSAVYGSRWSVSRLGLEARFPVHKGCVNALHFSSTGDWIASGSDDRQVVITDWQRNSQISRFTVGHTSNIFQVRFMPGSNDLELVTCSRDRSVRYAALSSSGQLQYSRVLTKHDDSCHKVDTPLDQPRLVLSAGQDCRVLWSDVRTSKDSGQLCLVDKVPLYSISCNPVRSQEFCVAGKDNRIYIYDRRKPKKSLLQLLPESLADKPRTGYHVTSVVYSGDGNSVLASYNDEDIYLMSVRPDIGGPITEHRYVGHRNVQTVTGVSFYGPNQEFVVSGSNDGHVVIWERESECLVNWFLADEAGVVNVLETHPFMPVMATSGLDHDIKLWSMLSGDTNEGTTHRAVTLDGEGLLERDQETCRIDIAWKTLADRVPANDGSALSTTITPPKLPFNLRNLQVITALNWKMRAESYPYSFDNTLENLMFMTRHPGGARARNIILSDSDSGDSMDNSGPQVMEEAANSRTTSGTTNMDHEGPAPGGVEDDLDSSDRGRPDGCRSS